MEQQIITYIKSINCEYLLIEDPNSIIKIKNLLINNIIYEPENNIENHYLGFYYLVILKDSNLGIKYYEIAIENGHDSSIIGLITHYRYNKINYELMKKYYLIGIERGNITIMHDFAMYYYNVEMNYDEMKKYLLMAIDKDHEGSINHLAYYYKLIKNYDKMLKYYMMGINRKNKVSFKHLEAYYFETYQMIKQFDLHINNPDMTNRSNIINIINQMANSKLNKDDEKKFLDIIMDFKFEENDKLLSGVKMLINITRHKVSMTKLHFEYSILGKGYEEAKNDFCSKIIN
jgi:TPR repeat protein